MRRVQIWADENAPRASGKGMGQPERTPLASDWNNGVLEHYRNIESAGAWGYGLVNFNPSRLGPAVR